MNFHIITIFPEIFQSYFKESIIGRAVKEKLIEIKIYDLRNFSEKKRKNVDDTPYGGGAGMVMSVEPIFKAVELVKKEILSENGSLEKTKTILFSAKGKKYTQNKADDFKNLENLIMICGRYEGVDERVANFIVDEEISIGNYVLTGGEIPAMVVVDSVSRLLPNVLGNKESLTEESFSIQNNDKNVDLVKNLEYPQYTKPREFNNWKVPEILFSGNHQEIKKWREENKK